MIKSTTNRILELDALRGIAAIFVVVFHYTMGNPFAFNQGGTGVDLFFIISGFVISLTIAKTKSWKDFIVNRFSRLFPTYWIIVSFTATLRILNGETVTLSRYLINLTMFQSYFKVDDIDWVYWTLLVEMCFYFFMILLFVTKALKNIEYIGLTILAIIILLNIPFVENNYPKYYREIHHFFPLFAHFPLFLSGIVFYKMIVDKQTILRYVILLLCFILEIWIFNIDIRPIFELSKFEYSIALLIWFSLFVLYVNNKLGFLVNRVTLFLGSISFSLYLIHQYIGLFILLPFFGQTLKMSPIIYIPLTILIVCLLSFINMKFIEKPTMNFIRNKYKQYKQKAAI